MNEIAGNIVDAVKEIKTAIVRAQSRVAANANAEMLSLYFGIGQYVSHKTKTEKWGTGIIDAISSRLQKEMPGLRGFSGKSIRKMRQFYEAWGSNAIWPSATAKLETGESRDESLPVKVAKSERKEVVRFPASRCNAKQLRDDHSRCRACPQNPWNVQGRISVGLCEP